VCGVYFITEESNEVFLHRKLAFTAASGDGHGAKFSDKTHCLYCAVYVKPNDVQFPATPLKFIYSFILLVFCLFLIFVLSFGIQPFKFQVFAAARALFSLGAYCGTVLLLLGEVDRHLRGHHCPICVLKAEVNNFTFHIFPCFILKISVSFIFLRYSAYLHYNHLQFSCCFRSNLFTSNLCTACFLRKASP
jgi:hypothetical protein